MSITKIRKRYEDNGYVVYAPENEMTFCNVCGKPVLRGMTTDNGDCHVHEDCFDKYMDDEYGKGKWKGVDELPDYEFPVFIIQNGKMILMLNGFMIEFLEIHINSM